MWSEKLLAYATYSRFKDKMSGKGTIPKPPVEVNEKEKETKI
jgi:hypothetical protein